MTSCDPIRIATVIGTLLAGARVMTASARTASTSTGWAEADAAQAAEVEASEGSDPGGPSGIGAVKALSEVDVLRRDGAHHVVQAAPQVAAHRVGHGSLAAVAEQEAK